MVFLKSLTQEVMVLGKPNLRTVRFLAKMACAKDDSPRCSPLNLMKTSCMKKLKKTKKEGKAKLSPIEKFFQNSGCCPDPCKDALPRFDDLYYKESDKEKRVYNRTWAECAEKLIKKKYVCSGEPRYPAIKRRVFKKRLSTTCSVSPAAKELMSCTDLKKSKCPRVLMPFCKGARVPPQCKTVAIPKDCKKRCTPYPSFSECKRRRPCPRPPTECNCFRVIPMCEVWEYVRSLYQRS